MAIHTIVCRQFLIKMDSLILTSIMQYRRQNRAALDVLGAMRLSNCGTYIILTAVVPQ